MFYYANIQLEAAVVAIVCIIFLILFAIAGIKGFIKNKD